MPIMLCAVQDGMNMQRLINDREEHSVWESLAEDTAHAVATPQNTE